MTDLDRAIKETREVREMMERQEANRCVHVVGILVMGNHTDQTGEPIRQSKLSSFNLFSNRRIIKLKECPNCGAKLEGGE